VDVLLILHAKAQLLKVLFFQNAHTHKLQILQWQSLKTLERMEETSRFCSCNTWVYGALLFWSVWFQATTQGFCIPS